MNSEVMLKKLKKSDYKRVYELFANDDVLDTLMSEKDAKQVTPNYEKKFLEFVCSLYGKKKPKEYHLGIYVENALVGVIGLNKIIHIHEKGEVGYWLGKDYWGKGYATKALKLFVKESMKKFKLNRLEAYAFKNNKASQRVLEKCGFKKEGERKKAVKLRGKFLDDIAYALVK